jgi:hypothetical protein
MAVFAFLGEAGLGEPRRLSLENRVKPLIFCELAVKTPKHADINGVKPSKWR